MDSHSIIFIIDNQELVFLSLETELNHSISLLLNLHKNIEQILTFKIGYSYIQIKINQIIWIESLVTI
mgnify:CR=1 FL=1